MTDLEIINKVEQVRKGNNVNWMDLVRLAFEVAPDRARPIFKKINEKFYVDFSRKINLKKSPNI